MRLDVTKGAGYPILTARRISRTVRGYPVDMTVRFCGPTLKELQRTWQQAVRQGHRRLILHITALLQVSEGVPPEEVAERVGVSEGTIYRWRHDVLRRRWDSLR